MNEISALDPAGQPLKLEETTVARRTTRRLLKSEGEITTSVTRSVKEETSPPLSLKSTVPLTVKFPALVTGTEAGM